MKIAARFRFILLLALPLLFGGCMLPLASKNYMRMDLSVKAPRVEIEQTGMMYLLSVLPLREPLDTKDVLLELMEEEECSDLKNIDIQYWNHSYYLLSWDKVRVIADCVKGPVTRPAPAQPVAPPAADDAAP